MSIWHRSAKGSQMALIFYVIFSVLGTLWVARDTKRHHMNTQGWTLFMLLTSIIGLPVYFFARKRHKARAI
jgi:hypothetical protein